MFFRWMLPTLLCAFASGSVLAQSHGKHTQCRWAQKQTQLQAIAAKPTVASPEQDKYDVKHVKLDISLTNTSTALQGYALTAAQVTAASLAAYVFELDTPMVVDSVKINGAIRPYTSTAGVHTVAFTSSLPAGTIFNAQVFYHNSNPAGGTARGIFSRFNATWHKPTTFSDCEPYDARGWWPCKQSLQDKIDSVDIWVTTDDSLKAASNGLLKATTTMAPGKVRYEWKHLFPIEYYLVSVAVANYTDYSYYMHFTGSTDSMLVQNYVYNDPTCLAERKPTLDSTALLINFFSDLFGRYPFWKEKYGHAMAENWGGMEHQTMSTMYDVNDIWLIAHELSHQWWGNSVSCASWSDIAISESFANYCSGLINELIIDTPTYRANMYTSAMPSGTVYTYNDTTVGRVFNLHTYQKGPSNINTLRHVFNNDANFFNAIRSWHTAKQGSNGSIANLRDHIIATAGSVINGIDIDTFFKQWFYLEGHPVYTVKWNKVGDDVFVRMEQASANPSSVPLFKVPLELWLRSPAGDTIVRVLNDQPLQFFHFTWNKPMNQLRLDRDNWLMETFTSVTKDITLVGIDELKAPKVAAYPYPNPTRDAWLVQGIPQNATLSVTDAAGRVLYTATASGSTQIPAKAYSPGIYLLSITNSNATQVLQLIKQ